MPRTPRMTLSAALAALALIGATGAASAATQVGVAAAVNPDALSHLGGVTTQVVIGKNILYKERIATSKKGLVQVLFVDGSTITVGPGSDLVIDKFVYDPDRGQGELSASITKGVLRFVGGRLSKNEGAVKFDTPVGTLGIRGGMFQGRLGEGDASFSFLFGDEMTFESNNGQVNRVFEANNTLVVGGAGGGVPTIRPTRPEDAQFFVAMLSGQGGPGGGAEGPTDDQVQNSGIGGANSGDGGGDFVSFFRNAVNNPAPDASDQSTTDIIRDFIQEQSDLPPDEPPTVNARVLLPGAYFDVFGNPENRIPDPETGGIIGGNPNEQLDDFVTTASIVDGHLIGVIAGLDQLDDVGEGQYELTTVEPHAYSIPWFTEAGIYQNVTGTVASADQVQPYTYEGAAVFGANGSFFFYDLTDLEAVDNDRTRLILLGGTPYQAPEASGKLRKFSLLTDAQQSIFGQQETLVPFAFANAAPADDSTDNVSHLLLLEQNDGLIGQSSSDGSKSVWLQTSFQLVGEGENQQSIIVVAAGTAVDYGNGPALIGERRGGSRVTVEPEYNPVDGYSQDSAFEYNPQQQRTTNFSGGISTLAGPDGNHLFGEAPHFVIGADSTSDSGNVFFDTPVDTDQSIKAGATYHVGEQIDPPSTVTQQGSSFQGYAAGMMQTRDPTDFPPNAVMSQAHSGYYLNSEEGASELNFVINLDAQANTLEAKAVLTDVEDTDPIVSDYSLLFGGTGISAYIDDEQFAAFETPGASQVLDDYGQGYNHTNAETYIVSGGLLNKQQIFGSDQAFCTQCDFIEWGAWGGKVGFGNQTPDETRDFFHMGWWVAGDVTANTDLPLQGSATYEGQAIGNVAAMQNGQWQNYTANGGMNMNWNFGSRDGTLNITNFDTTQNGGAGYNFSGGMSAPGNGNAFSGALEGHNMAGSAAGSFVNPPVGGAPGGVIGNWNVGGAGYKAVGVLGGKQTGFDPSTPPNIAN